MVGVITSRVTSTMSLSHGNQQKQLVGNAVINAALCGIYNDKKFAVVRFSMSVVFIFTTYIIVDYF